MMIATLCSFIKQKASQNLSQLGKQSVAKINKYSQL